MTHNFNETIKPKVKKTRTKHKVVLYIWLIAGLLFLILCAIQGLNSWFNTYALEFHKFVQVSVQSPITIEKRKPVEILSPLVMEILTENKMADLDPVEQIILKVFGVKDYKVARAIAIHENNYIGRGNKWDEQVINNNANNTVDVGIFQINQVHFKKPGCTLQEIVFAEKNILCAKSIYDEQGWNPWVVFQTGSFKRSL